MFPRIEFLNASLSVLLSFHTNSTRPTISSGVITS
jgi:hypothetical protein